ncbi:hypothetical protein [Listeria goaensis]|uniref:hypothetical protein n=1 Tax=Listeria goaensis TaxID=1649188 RepID=UPI000B588D90|nr:hypothetical protein [Listeria goaensis]
MAKKKKRKQKSTTGTPNIKQSTDTNQENILRILRQQNKNIEEITNHLKQQSSKKSRLIWVIPLIISLVSLVASIWIFFDTKKTTETMYLDTKRTTEIMNKMSIKNAPIDYKLNNVEIEKASDAISIKLSDEGIGTFNTRVNLSIESQKKQGQIKRAYLIQKQVNEKISRGNFIYLGNNGPLKKKINVLTPGNKILRVLPLYLLIEDYNGNVSIDYIRIHYAPSEMALILTSKSVQMDDAVYIGDTAFFPYFSPYTEYKQIDYSALMDSSYFQKTNRKLEESLKTYKNEIKNQYELLTNDSKDTYSKGINYFLNEKVDPISQNDVLTDVKAIKELYAQYYSN